MSSNPIQSHSIQSAAYGYLVTPHSFHFVLLTQCRYNVINLEFSLVDCIMVGYATSFAYSYGYRIDRVHTQKKNVSIKDDQRYKLHLQNDMDCKIFASGHNGSLVRRASLNSFANMPCEITKYVQYFCVCV